MARDLFSDCEALDESPTTFRPRPPAQPLPCAATEPDDDWPYDDDDDGNDVDGTFCFERAWIGLAGVTLDGEPAKLMRDMTFHMVRIDAVWSDASILCYCDTARRVIEQHQKRFLSSDEEDTGFDGAYYRPATFSDATREDD